LTRANEARAISKKYSKETAYELNIQSYQTTKISSTRNQNAYKASMFVYIIGVGLLYRFKKLLNRFGF
jgi:hypothetical protein